MFQPGDHIGPYRIESPLGRGGMASVYLAEDTALGRVVALKVLEESEADDEGRARFVREALALGRIDHENVVKVFAAGQTDGHAWMSLEYVDGDPLDALLVAGALDEESTLTLLAQVARGLKAVHDAGVVHRDVKPQNLLLDAHGVVRIADFGIAALKEPGASGGFSTQAGVAVGTPHFMAPEQARGEPATERTDAWGLGCTAFMLLTGNPPFFKQEDESDVAILARVLHDDVPDVAVVCPELSPGAAAAVARLLNKDAAERPNNLEAFADHLEDVLDGDTALDREALRPPDEPLQPTVRAGAVASAARAAQTGAPERRPARSPTFTFAAVAAGVLVVGVSLYLVATLLGPPPPPPVVIDDSANAAPPASASSLAGVNPGGKPALRLVGDDELVLKKPKLSDVLGSGDRVDSGASTQALVSGARKGELKAIQMLVEQKDEAAQTAVLALAVEAGVGPRIIGEIARQRALHHFGALQKAATAADAQVARAVITAAKTLRTVTAHTLLNQMSRQHPDEQIRIAAAQAQKAIFSVAAD